MPEGDTIYRSAVVLCRALANAVIERARLRDRQFESDRLVGATVAGVEARGKHLLMHLSTRQSLHSHMGMTGSWHIYRPGEPWRKPPRYAALEMGVAQFDVVCFSPKMLELLTADQLRRHPRLANIGPDLLAEEFDGPAAVARFRWHDAMPIGQAVMNQSIVAGIGNIYKSELLFLLGFDPLAPVACYSDFELAALVERARMLMKKNLSGAARQTRFRGDGGRLWVYGRSGEACYKCSATIQLRRQGEAGRTTCWCPVCQPPR